MSQQVDLKKKSKEVDAVDLTMFDDPSSQINFISMVLGKEHGWEATIYDPQTKPEDGPDRMPHIQSTLEKAGYATHLTRGEELQELRVRNIGTRESFMTSIHELGLVKGIGHTISIIPDKIHELIGGVKKFFHMISENPQRGIGLWYLGGDLSYLLSGEGEDYLTDREKEEYNALDGRFKKTMYRLNKLVHDPIALRKSFSGFCFTTMSVILLGFGKEGREAVMDDLLKGYNKALADGEDLGNVDWEKLTRHRNPVHEFIERNSMNISAGLMVLGKLATIDSAFYRLNNNMRKMAIEEGTSGEHVDGSGMLVDDEGHKLKVHRSGLGAGKGDWARAKEKFFELDKYLNNYKDELDIALEKQKKLDAVGAKTIIPHAEKGEGAEAIALTPREEELLAKHEERRVLRGVILEVAGPTASMIGWGMTAFGMGGRLANTFVSASSVLSLIGGGQISNPFQVVGEGIYLMGDAYLWATGERKFNTEVAKATTNYLRNTAPYVLSPAGENEVIRHTAYRYAEEELKKESKVKDFKPTDEQVQEKATEIEKVMMAELAKTPSRFERVVSQAAYIISQFPEADGMRDRAKQNMVAFIKEASVTVKAEAEQFEAAIDERLAATRGHEITSGRGGSKFLTVKELAGDAAVLLDAIPGSKYAENVLKLHEALVEAGARSVENGPSRIVESHGKRVMEDARAQSAGVKVAPQMQHATSMA